MEEQPKDRAPDSSRQYHHHHHPDHHHGDARTSAHLPGYLNHDPSRFFQHQHQETPTKKTGTKKVIISEEEGKKNLHLSDSAGMPHPSKSNGNRHASNANVKQKSTQKLYATVPKASSKGLDLKRNMDLKNDKETALDLNHNQDHPLDKRDSVLIQNGVVNCGLITNGYSSKDNDGSGSEGGYTTPKKRKARSNSIKNTDNVSREKERDMQQSNTTQEPGTFTLETEKGAGSRLEASRAHKAEAQAAALRPAVAEASAGESQRKNSDGKIVGTFSKKNEERHKAKVSSPSKEDSWTLFKPPPVFPVDNSSAKIVPKISYASKVKENLNKVAQGGGEALPPPVRLSQVPMSALKTITSASFTNGSVSGNGSSCPSVGTFFAPAASSIPPAPSIPSGENVASFPSLEMNCSSAASPVDSDAYELRKCTLLIYPLNMQPVLPSARQHDPPAAQTNQKALGDIFQNEWGLSFINEPNLGPELGNGPVLAEDSTSAVAPQNERQAAAADKCLDAGPPVPEDAERRTCAGGNAANSPPSPAGAPTEEETKTDLCGQETTKAEAKSVCAAGSASSKDGCAKHAPGQNTPLSFGASKEQAHPKDVGRRCNWGLSDIKAAVTYHTKEMDFLFNLQKQDPNRVVVYDETRDGSDQ